MPSTRLRSVALSAPVRSMSKSPNTKNFKVMFGSYTAIGDHVAGVDALTPAGADDLDHGSVVQNADDFHGGLAAQVAILILLDERGGIES